MHVWGVDDACQNTPHLPIASDFFRIRDVQQDQQNQLREEVEHVSTLNNDTQMRCHHHTFEDAGNHAVRRQ